MITFTLFPTLKARDSDEFTTDMAGLTHWLSNLPEYPSKADCPLISANTYGGKLSENRSLRFDGNINSVTGLVGDYDAGEITPGAAEDHMRMWGVEGVIVTTPSHGLKGNRWRVMCPITNPIDIPQRHELMGRLNTVFGGTLARESFPASQSFYVGRVEGVPYEVRRVEGATIDTLLDIPVTAPPISVRNTPSSDPMATVMKQASGGVEQVRGWLTHIPNAEPDWEQWNRIGMAVYVATGGSTGGLEAWREWSDKCMGTGTDTVDDRWAHYHISPPEHVGAGALHHMATENGFKPEVRIATVPVEQIPEGVSLSFEASIETVGVLAAREARLVRYNGAWYTRHDGGYYRELDEEVLKSEVRGASTRPLKLNDVSTTVDELKSASILDRHGVTLPHWLEGDDSYPNGDLIACRNGILEPESGTLYPHTDKLFTLNALPFDYDPSTPVPVRWNQFLREVFTGDQESINELQKLIGYLMTLDTSLQKIFAIIGPRRSGKGTIARVIHDLLGNENVCGPSLNSLGRDTALQSFIGKQAAIVPDARIGRNTDRTVIAEKLLSISGEDVIDIPRKYLTDWHGKLDARVVILSNDLPVLGDNSGALAGRYVVFNTPTSFYDREDLHLKQALRTELPGILNWALDGLRRLRVEKIIKTPAMARELVEEIDYLGSPVKAFVTDRCELDPSSTLTVDTLWASYSHWYQDEGRSGKPMHKAAFGRALHTAYPGRLESTRPYDNGKRVRCYTGIKLMNVEF